MKPSARVDSFKLEYLLNEAIHKIVFLGKINESEDNSSELAGFEINKLLREQSRLEQEYAELIKQRSELKGIKNREAHKKVEEKISQVSRSLKENTKKLCRLFKENTNLENDSRKVRTEREEVIKNLGELIGQIGKGGLDSYVEGMNVKLGEQNMLSEFLRMEKDLSAKIKDLKQRISEESKEFEDLRKEKKNAIHQLREEVTKAMTESAARIRYQTQVSETKIATAARMNAQKLAEIEAEYKEVMYLKSREGEVAEKMESFIKEETQRYRTMETKVVESAKAKKAEIRSKNLRLQVEIKREEDIITNMETELANEKAERESKENELVQAFKAKEDEEKKNIILDEKMKLIQYQFEEWMRLVGPSKKKGGGKEKK